MRAEVCADRAFGVIRSEVRVAIEMSLNSMVRKGLGVQRLKPMRPRCLLLLPSLAPVPVAEESLTDPLMGW